MNFKEKIRPIRDYPVPGMTYRDITTLLKDPEAYAAMIDSMKEKVGEEPVDIVVAPEARGFLLGAPLAYLLKAGFVPVRRAGRLPGPVSSIRYQTENGQTDELELHKDAIVPGMRVLVIDDLLATGSTALAVCNLVESMGGIVVGVGFSMEYTHLTGRETLSKYKVHSIIKY